MSTGLDVFDTTLQKTNELLKTIEDELGWVDRRNQTYLALRVVLHALRDRLPIHDSVNFAAQLPILVKGIYYDNWSSEKVPVKMDRQEFLNRIRQEFQFDVEGGIEHMTRVVLDAVFSMIDPGERLKLMLMLPDDIGELLVPTE